MHPPSKEELEQVWNHSNVGWLKDYNKRARGKTAYTLIAKPYRKVPLDPIEVTVWAKSPTAALKNSSWEVNNAVQKVYPYKENPDVAWTTGVKHAKS